MVIVIITSSLSTIFAALLLGPIFFFISE